jgi:predicted nicotinamide N-methyase
VQPKALNASRMGVGACVWEGEMLLAAYLASMPRHRFQGARCVELGCGPGLAGMVLAKMGANVRL